MRVLVACEFSGRVRDAFAARGHDAWSCDVLPTETPGQHVQGDVRTILDRGWDLMVAHPPCTYLSRAGARWRSPERDRLAGDAALFVYELWAAPIPRICLENPVGKAWLVLGRPAQTVHPWWFGDPHLKKTCLWLKGLAPLRANPGARPPQPLYVGTDGRKRFFTQAQGGRDRAKNRSRTFPGVARAMAEQWG